MSVRSDGFISLEPVGDVRAAGQSPAALAERLCSLYANELRQPDVTVVVKEFGGQVYVVGEVGKPAALAFATGILPHGVLEIADIGGEPGGDQQPPAPVVGPS